MGTTGDGRLTLVGKGSLSNKHELSLVAKRWQTFNFDAEVKVKFDPVSYTHLDVYKRQVLDHLPAGTDADLAKGKIPHTLPDGVTNRAVYQDILLSLIHI